MIFSSLESLSLRAIIKSQKCVAKIDGQHDFHQDRVLIHFVPDYCVEDPYVYPETRHVGLAHFVTSVYNRLLRVTMRETSRQFWAYSPPFENRFQVPAFTLARNETPRTQYQWDERPSLNSIDRHTLLHVGYRLSNSRRWLFAACIDERGEAHDIAVWGYDSQPFTWIVSHVWIFIKQFSQQADTEWRIVVSKLGEISEPEVEGTFQCHVPVFIYLYKYFFSLDVSSGNDDVNEYGPSAACQFSLCAKRHPFGVFISDPDPFARCTPFRSDNPLYRCLIDNVYCIFLAAHAYRVQLSSMSPRIFILCQATGFD